MLPVTGLPRCAGGLQACQIDSATELVYTTDPLLPAAADTEQRSSALLEG